MKCFFKRLKWCWRILRGDTFALFFVKGDDLRACKYGKFNEEGWQAIADFTQQTAVYSRPDALAQYAADVEALVDELEQEALLAEARALTQPKQC